MEALSKPWEVTGFWENFFVGPKNGHFWGSLFSSLLGLNLPRINWIFKLNLTVGKFLFGFPAFSWDVQQVTWISRTRAALERTYPAPPEKYPCPCKIICYTTIATPRALNRWPKWINCLLLCLDNNHLITTISTIFLVIIIITGHCLVGSIIKLFSKHPRQGMY